MLNNWLQVTPLHSQTERDAGALFGLAWLNVALVFPSALRMKLLTFSYYTSFKSKYMFCVGVKPRDWERGRSNCWALSAVSVGTELSLSKPCVALRSQRT